MVLLIGTIAMAVYPKFVITIVLILIIVFLIAIIHDYTNLPICPSAHLAIVKLNPYFYIEE